VTLQQRDHRPNKINHSKSVFHYADITLYLLNINPDEIYVMFHLSEWVSKVHAVACSKKYDTKRQYDLIAICLLSYYLRKLLLPFASRYAVKMTRIQWSALTSYSTEQIVSQPMKPNGT
jgi:hypothetical protein